MWDESASEQSANALVEYIFEVEEEGVVFTAVISHCMDNSGRSFKVYTL